MDKVTAQTTQELEIIWLHLCGVQLWDIKDLSYQLAGLLFT